MGSVQLCPDKEPVAASIIWLRLRPGVTFVLEDGWLGTTRALLALSLRSASRRDGGEGSVASSCRRRRRCCGLKS